MATIMIFFCGLLVGFIFGWIVSVLLIHANIREREMDIELEKFLHANQGSVLMKRRDD